MNGSANAKNMTKQSIESALAVFNFGQIQDFMTLYNVMRKGEISINDLEKYIHYKIARRTSESQETLQRLRKMPACPVCGGRLSIRPIRLPKGPANREGWKSLWYCTADDCVYEGYSRMTVAKAIKKLGLKKGGI